MSDVVEELFINQIARDDALQVRRRLDAGAIKRYEGVYRADGEMPPVHVAKVDGVHVLVDGWHRLTALENLGINKVQAKVTTTTRDEALWLAARANLEHGVPLRAGELRNVFRAYVRAKRNRLPRGRLKSYREIGAELGKPPATIYNWMKKDFPRVAAKMGTQGNGSGTGGLRALPRAPQAIRTAEESIQGILKAFQGSTDASERGAIIERLEAVLTEMKGAGRWEPSDY